MESFTSMMIWIQKKSKEAGGSFSQIHKIELAMEEALVNIIHYAYQGKPGTIEIACKMDVGQWIEFTIIDKGAPFDPIEYAPNFQVQDDLEDRLEGGLGIAIIKESMDEVQYERNNSLNILTLRKKISLKKA